MNLAIFSLLFSLAAVEAQSYTCSATEPCDIGCCGTGGYCGYGPTFCGEGNCTSSCDAKSDCDPGWGSEWSAAESCPLKVCCSEYGFCGTTKDFCGNKTVTSPSCSGTSASDGRTIGYYEGWSTTRQCDQMYPEQIPTSGYTHLNYAFAYVDPNSFAVAPMSETDLDLYTRFTNLKASNPGLQTWISIGGWSMNDPDQPTASTFSDLAASESAQSSFFTSLLTFMSTYGFDGVDMDWEYPVAPERSGRTEDFDNYVTFLKNLRNALGSTGQNYGLSITLPSSYWYMQNFDIVNIEPHIDFFNMMTYDLHGVWDSTDPYVGAIVDAHTNLTEIDLALELLWRNDIDPSKVTMGLGFYGRSFTLADPACNTAGCAFSSGGSPGPCTATSGVLSNAEILDIIAAGDATVTLDKDAAIKEVVWDSNQWVSYDDVDTFQLKTDYANSHCLGGFLVWAVSLDASNGTAAQALGTTTGLVKKALSVGTVADSSLSTCVWGECDADCPAGTSPAQSGSGKSKSNTGIYTGCDEGKQRNYCCPSDDVPSCKWRGTAPFCNGKCNDGEVQVASDLEGGGSECWTGHKVLCCTSTASDAASGDCTWRGSAPTCAGAGKAAACNSGETQLTYDSDGAGGEQICYTGYKSMCCTSPVPYTNCDWYGRNGLNWHFQLTCTGSCPAGKYPIATDPSWCDVGTTQFCCDVPTSLNDPTLSDFQSKLTAWSDDPGCAALTTTKRSSLSLSDQLDFFTSLSILFGGKGQSSLQVAELQLYNSILGDTLGASADDFSSYYSTFPGFDPVSLTSSLLCAGEAPGEIIDGVASTQSELCILPTDVNSVGCGDASNSLRRSLFNATTEWQSPRKAKRVISASRESVPGPNVQPSIGLLMRAVMSGEFTFQYVNLVQISDSAAGDDMVIGPANRQQGILEVAWLMAPNNDVSQVDSIYQEWDGTDITVHPPPDTFFVMHFHVDHFLSDELDGVAYAGIYAYNAFHGQYVNNDNRVDGRSNRNSRNARNARLPLMQCPGYTGPATLENEYIYPGYDVDTDNIESSFLNYLFEQGIFDPNGIFDRIITQDVDTLHGYCRFFDWSELDDTTTGSYDLNRNVYQRPSGF